MCLDAKGKTDRMVALTFGFQLIDGLKLQVTPHEAVALSDVLIQFARKMRDHQNEVFSLNFKTELRPDYIHTVQLTGRFSHRVDNEVKEYSGYALFQC